MKRIISLAIVFLILFSFLSVTVCACINDNPMNTSTIVLRAGGGGGGGGSGGGGSGGSGSSHNPGASGPASLLESILHSILAPLVFFSSSILFYIKLSKRSRRAKKLMKQMMQTDNTWKFKDISSTVKDSFFAIQTAWSNLDMTPASQYMSEDLFDSFQIKLKWMVYRKEKNILKDIRLIKALPVAVYDDPDNSRDYVWFYIKGKMVDYTINTETQIKISGNTSAATFIEYWQFTRKDNTWVLNKILQKNEADQVPFNE